MSLDAIRQLRRTGQKPGGVVTILIGPKPSWLDDDASMVVLRAADDPKFMDWRPMVGLWAAVITAAPDPTRTLAVLQALESVGAKCFGAADASGTYPTVKDAGPQHHRSLHRAWESLCR